MDHQQKVGFIVFVRPTNPFVTHPAKPIGIMQTQPGVTPLAAMLAAVAGVASATVVRFRGHSRFHSDGRNPGDDIVARLQFEFVFLRANNSCVQRSVSLRASHHNLH